MKLINSIKKDHDQEGWSFLDAENCGPRSEELVKDKGTRKLVYSSSRIYRFILFILKVAKGTCLDHDHIVMDLDQTHTSHVYAHFTNL